MWYQQRPRAFAPGRPGVIKSRLVASIPRPPGDHDTAIGATLDPQPVEPSEQLRARA